MVESDEEKRDYRRGARFKNHNNCRRNQCSDVTFSMRIQKPLYECPQSSQRVLIRGGTVVNADRTEKVDVLIENGVVKGMCKDIVPPSETRVIYAENMYVIPGGIDPHTHLEFEFMGTKTADDFYNGTKAAIAGGTTMIIDFAICQPSKSLMEVYDKYRCMADGRVCCDYALHMGVTWWSPQIANEMEALCCHHGINSFKMFLAYKHMFMLEDSELYEIFRKCKMLGAVPMVHAENGSVIEKNVEHLKKSGIYGPEGHGLSRPPDVEAEAVNRAAMIAKQVGSPLYVVHVMSKEAAEIIAKRRNEGQCNLYGETLASAVGTVEPKTCDFDVAAGHVMSPPIRSDPGNRVALMKYLQAGGLHTVGSDNCTFTKCQKQVGREDFTKIPNGVNGVEDRMSIVWEKGVCSQIIDPQKFVEITSTNAAKIFNIYPKKGCIGVNSDADIVIWNPKKVRKISSKTHHHANDFNIFEGLVVHGGPELVMVRGQVCYEDCQVKESMGLGKFVPCRVDPPFIYRPRRSATSPGPHLSASGDTSIPILQNLNFQERQLAMSALQKCAQTTSAGSLKLFKEMDPGGKGQLGRAEFSKILQRLGALSELSSREMEALYKGFGRSTSTDLQIDYNHFVKACITLFDSTSVSST